MQQADIGRSPRRMCAPTGNHDDFTASRRNVLSGLIAGGALATASGAAAHQPSWSAVDWLQRWQGSGAGVSLDGHGNPRLTPRCDGLAEAGTLLAELTPTRLIEVVDALRRYEAVRGEDFAVAEYGRYLAAGTAYPGDHEPGAEAAYSAAFDRSTRLLAQTPARTCKGLAAKLRAYDDSEQRPILLSVIAQLERMA